MIECTVFVYKHTFCSKGELIIGNNGYEIIYEAKHSKSTKNNTKIKRDTNHLSPDDFSYKSPSPSLSATSSNFLLSLIGHLSPTPMVSNTTNIIHRIIIDWDTISGLQRINKSIKYNEKQKRNNIALNEQLIIESTSYPTLHIMEYNDNTMQYETKSIQSLRTHYIGLEYDLMHSHDVLLGNNYHKMMKNYNFLSSFDIDSDPLSLLSSHPSYSLFINDSLPPWIWIPLLNHSFRVFMERMILIANICLFIWTIYQMTKYTSIIKGFYQHIFYPLFDYISKPILKKMYYFINLMRFNVMIQLFSNIFNLLYNYIPINLLYRFNAFFDQHILQQIINLFTMFYRLFINAFSIFSPLLNSIIFAFKQCLSFIDWNWIMPSCGCMLCKRLSVIWSFIRSCCRLCQRSQTLSDSTKILKAGVKAMNAADESSLSMDMNNASSIYNGIHSICNYLRSVFDAFWIGIGKPIKHCYDFFRYIRSEVGVVVAVCIRKICRKSKAKIKNSIIKNRNKDKDKDNDEDSMDNIDYKDVLHQTGLRFRGNKAMNDDENDEKIYSAIYGIQYYKDKNKETLKTK